MIAGRGENWIGRLAVLAIAGLVLPGLAVFDPTALSDSGAPHLSGTIEIDVARGSIAGHLCVERLPPRESQTFLLNKGLNIRRLRTRDGRPLSYRGEHELAGGKLVGEGLRYDVSAPSATTTLDAFCISYIGGFPVYAREEERGFDFKGVIAFTDRMLRAPEQAKWYPVPYDDATSIATYEITYDLEVGCPDCTGLFLNGAEPVRGVRGHFRSTTPRKPVLFAGAFDFVRHGDIWFVNGSVGAEAARVYQDEVERIATFYERVTARQVEEPPVLIAFDRLSSTSGFAFASWPTIALGDVRDFAEALEVDASGPGRRLRMGLVKTLSHEMGHYYFGTGGHEGPLSWFLGEAIPEWMSLLYLRETRGEEDFRDLVGRHRRRVGQRGTVTPLAEIVRPEQADEMYRYAHLPLLLLELERRFGGETVYSMVRSVLASAPGRLWDYDLLVAAVQEAGITPGDWARFESACLVAGRTTACVHPDAEPEE